MTNKDYVKFWSDGIVTTHIPFKLNKNIKLRDRENEIKKMIIWATAEIYSLLLKINHFYRLHEQFKIFFNDIDAISMIVCHRKEECDKRVPVTTIEKSP